jgi:hypothetical protein
MASAVDGLLEVRLGLLDLLPRRHEVLGGLAGGHGVAVLGRLSHRAQVVCPLFEGGQQLVERLLGVLGGLQIRQVRARLLRLVGERVELLCDRVVRLAGGPADRVADVRVQLAERLDGGVVVLLELVVLALAAGGNWQRQGAGEGS